ncbi:hypothetical protein GCM10027168_40120 [Streptomyces capparidis]
MPPRLAEELRQRGHHRAFRIGPPPFRVPPRDEPERPPAAVTAAATEPARDEPGATSPDSPEAPASLDDKALADAATNLWRAQRRLARPGEAPSRRSRQTGRYLRACLDALTEGGLVVQDHEGDAFHSGRSLEVMVFQDDPSLTEETVLETVRPTIYLHDRRIQMGRVIVGCPVRDDGAPPGADKDADKDADKERTGHA